MRNNSLIAATAAQSARGLSQRPRLVANHGMSFVRLCRAQSSPISLIGVPASALLFVFGRHVDPDRRRCFQPPQGLVRTGAFTAFMLFCFVCNQYESVVIAYVGMVLAPLMRVLLGVSGFKAK
jgi:hypothetical protein